MKSLENARSKVRESIGDKNTKISSRSEKEINADRRGLVDPKKLKKGDSVKIISMNLKGTVATLPDAKGNLFVMCGILRTQTNVSDLAYSNEEEITSPVLKGTVSGSGKIKMSKAMSISSEINLLGKTSDEAIAELEKYLDDAYIAHKTSVRIVHGKGTGALRTAVHNYLRRQKIVADYRLGEYGEGDAGVTIVTFK
jgi:DNA mismatch repair protein MutS2